MSELTSGTSKGPGKPLFSGFSHVSLPVRDLEESKRFYSEVLGGEIILDIPSFVEVRLGGIIVGLSKKEGGWTGRDAEFPHYAFLVEPENLYPIKERLEAYGVPTIHPWTRSGVVALMYFRDPSGNLFELYCPSGLKDVDKLPRKPAQGGNFTIDFTALNYEWKQR